MRRHIHFIIPILFCLIGSGALAINYTIPKGPLRMSNSGFVLAPEQMIHQTEFATVLENGRVKHFKNILLSPNQPIEARFDDDVFRKIYFDSNTGKVFLGNGDQGSSELTSTETLNDLKDYFLALGMESNPVINKFLQNYFPDNGIGKGENPIPPQTPVNPTESPAETPHGIDGDGPKNPRPIAPLPEEKPKDVFTEAIPAPDLFGVPDAQPQPQPQPEPQPQLTTEERDFECVKSSGGYKPQHKEFRKPLGSDAMTTLAQCELAVKASRNGVVCSFTGIGFKPTYFKGFTQSRPDYGYVGGSSMSFENCLFITERSTPEKVCFWGGAQWYSTHPSGTRSKSDGGPFNSAKSCVDSYGGKVRVAAPPAEKPVPPPAEKPVPPPATRGIFRGEEPPATRGVTERQGPFARPLRKLIDFFKPEPPTRGRVVPSAAKGHELISNNCMSCHKPGGTASEFPSWLVQKGELERRLLSQNPQEKLDAQDWVRKLNQVLNLDKSMPPQQATEQRHSFLKNPESAKFKAWIAQQNSKIPGTERIEEITPNGDDDTDGGNDSQNPRPQATSAKNSIQLLPQNKLNFYRSILPKVENPDLEAVLKDPNTIFFDKSSMVPGYQDPSLPVSGVRTTEEGFRGAGFAAGATQLYLNQQGHLRGFHKGVGLEGSGNTNTFHFLNLPKDANGNLQKIKVFKRIIPPDETPVYDWVFPKGTVSGEIVYNTDSAGKPQVLEIRTRTKDRDQGAWAPDIVKPFPTASSLSERLTEVAQTNPALKAEAEVLQRHLRNPARLQPLELKRDGFQKGNFESRGGTDVLPNMSETMVKALLATPFKSSLGTEWDNNGRVTAFAPTSNQPNGIVSQHGRSGAIRVDRESCNKCHEDSNKPIYKFFNENHPMFNSSIRAYGNLPGSDRNLRFTIFDQNYFRRFGNDGQGDNRVIRRDLLPILDIQR
ncbi:MAG: hypothetical protein EBR01_04825 [Proteobacteria bacterium]|nr:hypothetical protein [Pseudomonadota bacterium]